MASRDFGYITLRNIAAYQPNGNPVPPNQVLVTSGTGEGRFTNRLIISTICVSTIQVSTIFIDNEIASSINTNYLTVNSTANISSLTTNFLTVNSTTLLSTTIINNTLSLIGNTPGDSEINLNNYNSRIGSNTPYNGLYLEASTTTSILFSNLNNTAGPYAQIGQGQSAFNGSVNVASTLTVSTFNTNQISTSNIQTNFVSTFNHIALFDGTSSVILDAQGSTLYVNGHPIITGGGISSVSSLFWLPGPDGTIYNENLGTLPGNYNLVGIGTNGAQLTALLDVAGTTRIASTLTVSSIVNVQQISTFALASASAISTASSFFIDYTVDIGYGPVYPTYPVLRFNSLKDGAQPKSLILTMGDGNPTWTSSWENFVLTNITNVCDNFYINSNSTFTQRFYTSTINTSTIYMFDVNSNLSFSSILNINSGIDATDNGLINIGTSYNPTITLGSAGTAHTVTMNGNLNVIGTAISRVATVAVTSDPGISGWNTFLGKYCFVDGASVGILTLPTNVTLDGTILVIRNTSISASITVTGATTASIILAGKTTSYVYTTSATAGWYTL